MVSKLLLQLHTLLWAALAWLWFCMPAAGAAQQRELVLHAGQAAPSWRVTVADFEGREMALSGDAASLSKPADGPVPANLSSVRTSGKLGERDALTMQWKDAWYAAMRIDGGPPLDLRPYLAHGTLEFDLNVANMAQGGIYLSMRCGPECVRKVPYVLAGRALQGKGWQHLAFSLSCFARKGDDFSKVTVPFQVDASGSGEIAVANVKLVAHGQPNAACPDYRTESATPAPLSHAWAIGPWMARHEQKLDEVRKLKEAGRPPQLVFIGDSITEGWEKAGLPVWKEYYEKYNALALGFGGDHTENVLWRLQHGEVDGIAPKVAVLMIGTNNTGDRQDEPEATAAGVKRIIDELRQRLPRTKIVLCAVFPREASPGHQLRRINERVNTIIQGYADGRNVIFTNINAALTNPDGTLSRDIMPDLLHPGEKGYAIWARSLEPGLRKLLSE